MAPPNAFNDAPLSPPWVSGSLFITPKLGIENRNIGFPAGKCSRTCYLRYGRDVTLPGTVQRNTIPALCTLWKAVSTASCHRFMGGSLKRFWFLDPVHNSSSSIAQHSIIYLDGVNCGIKEWALSADHCTVPPPSALDTDRRQSTVINIKPLRKTQT